MQTLILVVILIIVVSLYYLWKNSKQKQQELIRFSVIIKIFDGYYCLHNTSLEDLYSRLSNKLMYISNVESIVVVYPECLSLYIWEKIIYIIHSACIYNYMHVSHVVIKKEDGKIKSVTCDIKSGYKNSFDIEISGI